MVRILTSLWWSRAWVIQEATTPCNGISVILGHRRISFDVVNYLLKFLQNSSSDKVMGINWPAVGMKYRTRERRDPENIARKDMIDLQWISHQGKSHTATDSKDKVYSVLALAIDTGESGLRPDYTIPVRDVISLLRSIS